MTLASPGPNPATAAAPAEVEQRRAAWFTDPVRFLGYELEVFLWGTQAEIIRAIRPSVRLGRILPWLMCFANALAITTAPTEHQVRDLLWREIRRIHRRNAALIGGNLTRTSLEIGDRHFATGLSTDAPERFQGFHDEASGVREDIFEAIEGRMNSSRARLLLTGNPISRSGTFYDAFHAQRGLWHTIHISAFDTPNRVEQEIKFPGLVTRLGAVLRLSKGGSTRLQKSGATRAPSTRSGCSATSRRRAQTTSYHSLP